MAVSQAKDKRLNQKAPVQGRRDQLADHISIPRCRNECASARLAWAPLREPLFRSLWIAAVVSYTGTWMQNVGAGWLMTQLTDSPLMVGLVQAAAAIPVFLVVLPAGALADMVDRRRLLLFTQGWMVLAAAALGILTLSGAVSPWVLLLFTFLMGVGAVMNDPAWQAITPEVVSPQRHASAVALNSAGFNVARAAGPALGGIVVAAAGAGWSFLLNAASFLRSDLVLVPWKRTPMCRNQRADQRGHQEGFRYVHGAPQVRSVLIRTGAFSFGASFAAGVASRRLSASRRTRIRISADLLRAWSACRGCRAPSIAAAIFG